MENTEDKEEDSLQIRTDSSNLPESSEVTLYDKFEKRQTQQLSNTSKVIADSLKQFAEYYGEHH